MDYTIIGGAVNLAARLESSAEPGTILIAHETWALVKDAVLAKEVPPFTVKGIAQPLHAYEVIGLPSKCLTASSDATSTGMRITIDLSRSNREKAIDMLQQLIGEIDGGATPT